MSRFWKHLIRRVPRHGEGLLGVGAAYAAAAYLSVLFAEIFSGLIPDGYTSFNKAFFSLITLGSTKAIWTVLIFMVLWIFLGAIAFAGSTRYMMGCVDPDHIAQRTFSIGIKNYTKKMIAYSMFLVAVMLAIMGLTFLVFRLSGIYGLGARFYLPVLLALGIIIVMLMTKVSYTPMFMIQGKGLFAAISKSWKATAQRFWLINFIRLVLVAFVFLPILLKYFLRIFIIVPSIEIWPFAALIIVGFEEIMVTIGFQEYEEDSKEPIITESISKKDLSLLEDYNRVDAYADPQSGMEL
ncbi:MAG: hypothetical protein KA140_05085 [Caldisericia bacterium]|nr:hypothetical protein [Caldisericia bacterium]